jgi:hypothetical protein
MLRSLFNIGDLKTRAVMDVFCFLGTKWWRLAKIGETHLHKTSYCWFEIVIMLSIKVLMELQTIWR